MCKKNYATCSWFKRPTVKPQKSNNTSIPKQKATSHFKTCKMLQSTINLYLKQWQFHLTKHQWQTIKLDLSKITKEMNVTSWYRAPHTSTEQISTHKFSPLLYKVIIIEAHSLKRFNHSLDCLYPTNMAQDVYQKTATEDNRKMSNFFMQILKTKF